MRDIEKKIIETLNTGKKGFYQLSKRDRVFITEQDTRYYSLWRVRLYRKENGKHFFFLYDAGDNNPMGCMSNTTKSRINAILLSIGVSGIRQKNYKNFFNGKELKMNCWYELLNNELVRC